MKRALPVVALTVVGLIPLWRYAPSPSGGTSTEASSGAAAAEVVPAPSSSSPSGASSSGPATTTQVVRGSAVNTEKGTVQVELTFEGDEITSVRMLQQPDHPQTRDSVPVLIEETLSAQGADIDTVSGATVTSDGYRKSLQAALDARG
ncbi:FMN-binding protein [Streptomyces sp. CRN 30]|uniref:FMN-binding protein n=1 Tax=Streptomyces sp. CRN 30 TaxID=3075613 RepID=UPI002A7EBF4B|nr:FMN-binding protein [Streptomyces sp. CRN 30]